MIHPGLAALKHRDKEEYAADYRARFSEIPDSEVAHHCWRCEWEDADTEALESARHKQASAEGREYHFEETWGNLFDSGEEAREPTVFLLKRSGRNLGKRAGLRSISTWVC